MTREEARKVLENSKKQFSNNYDSSAITLYEYWGKIERIVDGDTFDITVSVGFNAFFKNRFRLVGVNCPETFGVKKESDEYARGLKSLEAVEAFVSEGSWVELKVFFGEKEKYGRWLCEIIVDGVSLNEYLLANDLAKPTV